MSSIEELRDRVNQAEERFGLIKEQRAKYSERLVSLIDAIETRLRDQNAEIERQTSELAVQSEELASSRNTAAENQALRGMLHSLLQAIEAGGGDMLTETMQVMDSKVSTLIEQNVKTVPALEAPEAAPEAEAEPDDVELVALEGPAMEQDVPDQAPETLDQAPDAAEDLREPSAEEVEITDEAVAEADLPEAAEEISAGEPAPDEGAEVAVEDTPRELVVSQEDLAALVSNAEAPETEVPETEAPETEALEAEAPEPEILEVETPGAEALEAEAGMDLSAALDDELSLASEPVATEAVAGEAVDAELELEVPEAPAVPEPEDMVSTSEVQAEEEPLDTVAEGGSMEGPMEGSTGIEPLDDIGEVATLEEIMRRVSKLVEEEGALGQGAGASVRIGAEASDETAHDATPAAPDKVASNG